MFWNNDTLPESHEAWMYMASFFDRYLGQAKTGCTGAEAYQIAAHATRDKKVMLSPEQV